MLNEIERLYQQTNENDAESFGIVDTLNTRVVPKDNLYLGMCRPKGVVILTFLLPNFHTVSREIIVWRLV